MLFLFFNCFCFSLLWFSSGMTITCLPLTLTNFKSKASLNINNNMAQESEQSYSMMKAHVLLQEIAYKNVMRSFFSVFFFLRYSLICTVGFPIRKSYVFVLCSFSLEILETLTDDLVPMGFYYFNFQGYM